MVFERKILLGFSAFVALFINSRKLLSLFDELHMDIQWRFNLPELIFQTVLNFFFAFFFGWINYKYFHKHKSLTSYQIGRWILLNAVSIVLCYFFCLYVQRFIFQNVTNIVVYRGSYMVQFLVSVIAISIIVKMLLLYKHSREKAEEAERLKLAYKEAQLQNLKDQVNPHFFFNSLSSLSALVREDQGKAQRFIANLSQVFRGALQTEHGYLQTVEEELKICKAYAELQQVRLESAFQLEVAITKEFYQKQIPHMSIQNLIENAIKHNRASLKERLKVQLFEEDDFICCVNNLQPQFMANDSSGIGLYNINERCKLLIGKELQIVQTETMFTVKVPWI